LKGKDLAKLEVSTDRIIALSKAGRVYSIPCSRDDQDSGPRKEEQKSSWSLWSPSGSENISFREWTPALASGEKITGISSGLEHCLMLTSQGRVFAAASSLMDFPSRGQLGIPGLKWDTRPKGAFDQAYELMSLKGFAVDKIATGDYHSVILDKAGRIFTFGDNTFGQLGFAPESKRLFVDMPSLVSLSKLYTGTGLMPQVTSIFAGGTNTFFSVDAVAPQNHPDSPSLAPSRRMPRETTDTWVVGHGVYGTLGTGKWTHVCSDPAKIPSLSSLFEFDEKTNRLAPIRLKALSVGATHCAAVMDLVTETAISNRASANETNWGADVVFWGGNEHYQLGTGKRSNVNAPAYIGLLDGGAADADKGRKGETHRLCLTPRQTARLGEGGKGRKVTLEQKVECGRFVTGVYSAV
jgi:alpha-tubulin suppressor-like RCC1 family protein